MHRIFQAKGYGQHCLHKRRWSMRHCRHRSRRGPWQLSLSSCSPPLCPAGPTGSPWARESIEEFVRACQSVLEHAPLHQMRREYRCRALEGEGSKATRAGRATSTDYSCGPAYLFVPLQPRATQDSMGEVPRASPNFQPPAQRGECTAAPAHLPTGPGLLAYGPRWDTWGGGGGGVSGFRPQACARQPLTCFFRFCLPLQLQYVDMAIVLLLDGKRTPQQMAAGQAQQQAAGES